MDSNEFSGSSLRIRSQRATTESGVPLYAAMDASPEYVIYYENKFLSVFNHDKAVKKIIQWPYKTGHVIDISRYNDNQFVILTKLGLYLINVDTEKVDTVHQLSNNNDESTIYHRCTAHNGRIMLSFSGAGTIIEQWTSKVCAKRWSPPKSCGKNEHISCLRLSSDALGLTIAKSIEESRFEVRQLENMSILFSIPLNYQCYRFISLNNRQWLLVPYYRGRQDVFLVDTNQENIKPINVPLLSHNDEYDGNYSKMIWNIALMLGDSSYLIVRRERTVCCYSIE